MSSGTRIVTAIKITSNQFVVASSFTARRYQAHRTGRFMLMLTRIRQWPRTRHARKIEAARQRASAELKVKIILANLENDGILTVIDRG